MNNILSKILCCLFIVFGLSISACAKSFSDTTLLANNATENSAITKTITIPASVSYPGSLQNNKEASLDYVEKLSNKKREYLIRTYQRGKKFFPKIIDVLSRYNLPQELKVLIALESGFNADVVSKAGAVGYWQFMDDAAREYGLHIGLKDDRKNLKLSTMAAAQYLSDMSWSLNNDLLLTVAAYNCGIGNVRKAIKKTGNDNADFWETKKYLPAETKNYVMNFIALNVIFNNYDKFINHQLTFAAHSTEITIPETLKTNTTTD